jgi:hypothetical protein
MLKTDVKTELDRQTDTLLALGYADLAAVPEDALRSAAGSLAEPLEGHDAFVLVVHPAFVPISARVPLLALGARPGTLSPHFADVDTFRDVVEVPDGLLYAVTGVDRGEEFCGVRPADAALTIADRGRTMLTMAEGIAFLHAHPEALEKNKCFHTGASRGTDRRVPALWISGKAPHLGWCWEHNHHTWLGVASAETRITAAAAPVVADSN